MVHKWAPYRVSAYAPGITSTSNFNKQNNENDDLAGVDPNMIMAISDTQQ